MLTGSATALPAAGDATPHSFRIRVVGLAPDPSAMS